MPWRYIALGFLVSIGLLDAHTVYSHPSRQEAGLYCRDSYFWDNEKQRWIKESRCWSAKGNINEEEFRRDDHDCHEVLYYEKLYGGVMYHAVHTDGTICESPED